MVAFLAIFFVWMSIWDFRRQEAQLAPYRAIVVGMSEKDVESRLGKPSYTYLKGEKPSGLGNSLTWGPEKYHQISGKVMIYLKVATAYYYFNPGGFVEAVVVQRVD